MMIPGRRRAVRGGTDTSISSRTTGECPKELPHLPAPGKTLEPRGQEGGYPPRSRPDLCPSQRVDAPPHRIQPTPFDPVRDRPAVESELDQLAAANHSMLSIREL
jgi:hypothetical protein